MTPFIRNAGKALLQSYYTPESFLWRLPVARPAVALTFDDGPDPAFTERVLDLLALTDTKATFFVIGEKVERYPDLVRKIAAGGHGLGGHTFSHSEITQLSGIQLEGELARCRQAIREASGIDSALFRPPRGRMDLASIRRSVKLGYCLVHWSKTYSDFRRDGVEPLVARLHQAPPVARDIVLFHDHNADTVAALARLLPEWRKCGMAFAAL